MIVKLMSRSGEAPFTAATLVFIAIWFVAAAANMWMGVSRAGYSFREELPIFLVVFLLPVIVAVVTRWKLL